MKQIRLSGERFWVERGNFELWPEALSRLPEIMEAATARDVSERYLKRFSSKKGRLDRAQDIYGLMGLHITREGIPEIKGVGLLCQEGGALALSREALEIVNLYRQGGSWLAALAGQLVKYSPRCRVLLYLLWEGAVFVSKGRFPDNLSGVRLLYEGKEYLPFNGEGEVPGMNRLLEEYKEEALGPYWQNIITAAGVNLDSEWCFSGVKGPVPTTFNLRFWMGSPLELFHHLGWFDAGSDSVVRLNRDKMKEVMGEALFFGERHHNKVGVLEAFKGLIEEYRDYRGYFPVEPVLEQLVTEYPGWDGSKERFADYFLTQGMKNGDFILAEHHSGQPRHGRGYLGKRDYQLIKLIFRE